MFNKRTITSAKSRTSNFSQPSPSSSKMSGKVIPNNVIAPESPETEGTINIPHIKIKDNSRLLPKYTAALERSKDDQLPAEDLDSVQRELESLLTNVALRYRVLKAECDAIDRDEKRFDRRQKAQVDKPPHSPGKRKRAEESRKPKIPHFKLTKQKQSSAHSPAQSQNTDDSMDALPTSHLHKDQNKVTMLKNDIPNKFWLSVEPYCMPITNEDLRLLDDLLEQYSGPLVPPIPELGAHYSTTWALEDLKEEENNSNPNVNSKSRSKNNSNNEVMSLLRKGEQLMGEGVTGPLTQRLVSAFLEENLIGDVMSNIDSNSSSDNTNSTNSTLCSLSLLKNGIDLEKRVKQELIEQGLLETEEFVKPDEDEVYSEIKRVTAELSSIAEYNSTELRRLQEAAKCEIKRLEIKRKLDVVDHEILEAYKRTVQAKQKRRVLTNEEQEEIFRLTSEQKRLSDQLEKAPNPVLSFND
ncbi:transcriptional adapter 3-B [Episyrphus balteatus]|uniref:transcriptional adapter 3-B n=1 Tax=Episyrphus balteatus TaxID=286459 RepID=UPI002484F1A9|nr:transcriptional adapter 3-B [Episyrphus balteatus]